jgi:SAM-dependent methyltransferase
MSFIQLEGLRKAEYGDASPEYECSENNNVRPLSVRILRSIIPPSWIKERPVERDVPWYIPEPGSTLTKAAKIFFQDYTGITDDDKLIQHLCNIRDRAWRRPYSQYPYLGRWWFLRSIFALTPYYEGVLAEAKEGASILDIGCGFGHELRYLRSAGAKGKMYAIDIQQEMWDLGLKLFADKKTPPATFIKAEVVRDDEGVLKNSFPEALDIVLLCRFLDFHDFEFQRFIVEKITNHISKVGTRIVGYTLGRPMQEEMTIRNRGDRQGVFCHCEETLKWIWQDISKTTNTEWHLDVEVADLSDLGFEPEDHDWMAKPPLFTICFNAVRTA